MRKPPLPEADLEHILARTRGLAPQLQGRRILLTGGTGFFGTWLLESFLSLNREHSLGAAIVVLSRSPETFRARSPHIACDSAVSLVRGDIRSFQFPSGKFSHVIHAATDTVSVPGAESDDPFSVIVDGTRHVLDFAESAGAERLLFVSSGAVYGQQPDSVLHVHEDAPFLPSIDHYTLGKRAAEQLCLDHRNVSRHAVAAQKRSNHPHLQCVLARCFAFLGPHLPLRAHFAAGNLLANALDREELYIRGDGTPLRSYLYAADLAIWLWTLLLRGEPGRAYNVGSQSAVSIRELAEHILHSVEPGLCVKVRGEPPPAGTPPSRYIPSTQRATDELGLTPTINLKEAILRTLEWHRMAGGDLRK